MKINPMTPTVAEPKTGKGSLADYGQDGELIMSDMDVVNCMEAKAQAHRKAIKTL